MKMADRNCKWGIEQYGAEKWNQRCDYEDDKESRKERLFEEASKSENMAKLFAIINDFFGEDMDFHYKMDVEKRKINIASGVDLSDRPFIRFAWKKFIIENFGGGIGCSEPYCLDDRDYSKPVKEVYYWMDVQYSYKHIDGGSNGASIGTAYFKEDGKWTFVPDVDEVQKKKLHEPCCENCGVHTEEKI